MAFWEPVINGVQTDFPNHTFYLYVFWCEFVKRRALKCTGHLQLRVVRNIFFSPKLGTFSCTSY